MTRRFTAVQSSPSPWLKALLIFVCLVMLFPLYATIDLLWGARNMGYQIEDGNLVITYSWRSESIPLSELQSIEVIEPTGLVRVGGSSVPGHYSGRWRSRETGPLRLYATRLDSLVLLKTAEKAWGLTPTEPAAFVSALKSGTPGRFPVSGSGSPLAVAAPMLLLILVMVPGMVYILRLIYRFPKALTYELGADALVIETGWRPVRVPYREIESVEETTLKGWPVRMVGSELKGVHWGLFAWSAVPGKRIRLYATQLKPIVLIRAGKGNFGLSPADPAGFVQALQERIGR